MNLCSDGHEEVCYETRDCPVCEVINDLEAPKGELEKEVRSLEQKIEDLKEQLSQE